MELNYPILFQSGMNDLITPHWLQAYSIDSAIHRLTSHLKVELLTEPQ